MAQHLPFSADAFDYVTAINVMEHVMEAGRVMAGVWECLRPGGLFVADSRNRFDLFFPEPHVKLRWIGFLPRRWVRRYVGWRTGHPYENIRLLSYGEWLRLLRSKRWRARVVSAPAAAYGYSPAAGRIVDRLTRLPLLGRLLLAIAPSHLILAQKLGGA
jgi:SAM-dependent methyltransferase